jgi:epoxyqueuosine reductase QueG
MTQKSLEGDVRNFLDYEGMQLSGIADIRGVPSVPEDFTPQAVLNGAKSVICYGIAIPKGVLYADNHDLSLYWRYCTMVYKSLDMVSNKLSLFLEEKGHVSSPVYGCYPMKVVEREYWGSLPLVYWSEAAGLGRLTKCGLLAHPDFGMRLIVGGVITTARLTPSGKIEQDFCPPDCFDCIKACPVNAIGETGKVDHTACMRYANASPLLAAIIQDKTLMSTFTFETILNTVAVDEHATYSCNKCLAVCPLNQ